MRKIKNKDSLLSWLYSVSTHYCISVLRKKRQIEFDETLHSDNVAEEQQRQIILKEVTARFMKPWNKKVRQAVVYTYIDGYTQPEIAKLMGIGESTIRRYLTEFRRKAAGRLPGVESTI